MSLLNMLREAQGGRGLGELARQFGMEEREAGGLAEMLAPAIGSAAKKRAESGGLERLLGQLQGEAQGRYFDDGAAAAQPEARAQGENFLENLLGSREARDDLAREAASRSGVEESKVSEFMPALAAMLQGGMQKRMPDTQIQGMMEGFGTKGGSGLREAAPSGGGGLMGLVGGLLGGGDKSGDSGGPLGMLNNLLDADGDGSALDDILERVMKR